MQGSGSNVGLIAGDRQHDAYGEPQLHLHLHLPVAVSPNPTAINTPSSTPASTMADTIPPKLKSLQLAPFAKRAAQLDKFKPIVTYWCESSTTRRRVLDHGR
jgi:hypothetical protein